MDGKWSEPLSFHINKPRFFAVWPAGLDDDGKTKTLFWVLFSYRCSQIIKTTPDLRSSFSFKENRKYKNRLLLAKQNICGLVNVEWQRVILVKIYKIHFRRTVLLQACNPLEKFAKLSVTTPVDTLVMTGVFTQTVLFWLGNILTIFKLFKILFILRPENLFPPLFPDIPSL